MGCTPSPAQRCRGALAWGEPPAAEAVARRARAVPGWVPGPVCAAGRGRALGLPKPRGAGRGCRGRLGAGPASPSPTSPGCPRRCHPALGQDRTQPRGWRGPCPGATGPAVPRHPGRWDIISTALPAAAGSLPGRPMDVSPSRPQPGGHSIPRGRLWAESPRRAAGPGLPCPFPAPFRAGGSGALSPSPLGALQLHIYRDANITPRKFPVFTSQAKACSEALTFFFLSMRSGGL